MKTCRECSRTSPDDAFHCINCGNPFSAEGATRRLSSTSSYRVGLGSAPVIVEPGRYYSVGTIGSAAPFHVSNPTDDALEQAAQLAEQIGWSEHERARDPQEDNSDATGERIATAIRALKGTKR
jgi:hypothetical protein